MNPPGKPIDQFVRRLHRRQVALRVAERAGLGLLSGCAAAVVLVPVLLWRGQDAWGVAAAALSLGALAGVGWGVARRPNALAAAAEADRQLGTADLLSTAWALRGTLATKSDGPDGWRDAWRRAVLAQAAERCAALSPSRVLLRRFGGRAWGGIALAVALVVTLASFSSGPLRAHSPGRQFADARSQLPPPAPRPILQMAPDGSTQQRRAEQNPGDERERGQTALPAEEPDATEPDSVATESPSDTLRQAAASGAGDGAGRTVPEESDPTNRDAAPMPDEVRHREPGSARASGGAGRAARDPAGTDDRAGGTLAEAEATPAAPPWQHGSWDAAVQSASEAIRAGRISDEHRDLVRGYFARPGAAAPSR